MEISSIIYSLLSLIMSLLALWWGSKYLKFKRNKFVFAFLVTAILFVISSISTFVFYFIPVSFTVLIIRIAISLLIFLPLWFYVIMKIYAVPLRDAFRMFGFLLRVGLIIYFVVFLPLSLILHFSGIQIVPEKSCEEKYSSFPEKYLPDKTREEYLEICNIGSIVHESNPTPDVDAGIKNFEIIDTYESGNPKWFGEKINENYFKVYRNKLISLTGSRALNLRSSVAFDEKSENISMDLNCVTPEGVFVSSMVDDGQRYRFESIPQSDLDFKLRSGYGYLQCDQTCTKDKVTFRFKYYGGVDFYYNNTELAEMNTGELMGTRLIYTEANKPTMIALGFILDGEDSTTIECNVRVVSQSPLKTFEKSFTIEYITKDTESKDYIKLD